MKKMKRVLALVLALAMALSMTAISAFAGDAQPETPTGSITIKDNATVKASEKEFKAYKILDATFSKDNTGKVTAVSYTVPAGMKNFYNTYSAFQVDGKTVEQQLTGTTKTFDQLVAEKIAALDTAATLQPFIEAALTAAKASGSGVTPVNSTQTTGGAIIEGLASGYYIVEDQATQKPVSSLMLDTVTDDNVDITVKANNPPPQKEILTADELVALKANEVGIGRTVNYRVKDFVPNYAGYDHFYYIYEDTLSKGLTFNNDVVVMIDVNGDGKYENVAASGDNPAVKEVLVKDTDYYLYTEKDDTTGATKFEVAFENIMAYPVDATIVVTYSANVNMDAITGVNPNTNEIEVHYSSNPSKSQRPEKEEIPGKPNSKEDHPLGDSPKSITNTYTTKITIQKIDGDTEEPLEGVEFTLTGKATEARINTKEVFNVAANGTYYLLKDGTYTTTAPKTEASLEETTENSGWVEDATYTGADARTVEGKTLRPYQESDGTTVHYIIVEANTGDYVSTTVKYSKETVTTTTAGQQEYDVLMTGTTDANGLVSFEKLGAGTFTISETGALDGYNKIADIKFTTNVTLPEKVETGTETATWTVSEITPSSFASAFVEDTDESGNLGTFTVTIENNKGTELPSTGGIGTTIFYIVGAVLVLGAGVVMITRRRMDAQ